MARTCIRPVRKSTRAGLAVLALAASCGWSQPSLAQTRIAALVNGTPITTTEVNERRAFVKITQRKDVPARQALDTLIDETLIQQEGKRRTLTVADAEVDQRYGAIAANMKLGPDQLAQALAQSGASARTFKTNIRTQILQRKLIAARMRTTAGVAEKDIAIQMSDRKQKGENKSYRYVLQQIVFVVPQGSSPAVAAQRRTAAEGLRKQVQSCDQAVAAARKIRDVAAKAPVIRMSGQLSSGMRDELGKLQIGQTMPSSQTDQGIEFMVLCERKDAPDDTALRQEIQNELVSDQSKVEGEKFVADLRKRALIEYR